MKFPLLYLMRRKIKEIKNYFIVVRKNPSCEIRSMKVSRKAELGKYLKIRENVKISARVSIGDYARINQNAIIINASIGRYCSIGYYTIIGLPNHSIDWFTASNAILYEEDLSAVFPNDPYGQPPKIGHDVWIASNCMVLQGVTIGDGAIIGGGSVVTKDVESGWFYAGIPAKKIRPRRTDDTSLGKLGENWYQFDREEIVARLRK